MDSVAAFRSCTDAAVEIHFGFKYKICAIGLLFGLVSEQQTACYTQTTTNNKSLAITAAR